MVSGCFFSPPCPQSSWALIAHEYIKEYLFTPHTVAIALAVGAVLIFIVESTNRNGAVTTLDEITPGLALGIGVFQCLALWPGFSRSAATIMGGMLLGAKRTVAAEYSFIAAVPIMFAATGYDFIKSYQLFELNDLIFLLIGFVVSFLSAWLAIKGFIFLLGKLTLRPFAVYRLALAPMILLFL